MFGTIPINVQVTPGAAFTDEWGVWSSDSVGSAFLKVKDDHQGSSAWFDRVRSGASLTQYQ